MPQTIAQAQKGFDFNVGESSDNFELFTETENVFEQYGIAFIKKLGELANQRGVVASGELLSKAKYKISKDGSVMEIYVPDYFDYPNQGVKGVKSSKNAPKSPYQYKNYGMNEAGRRSIKKYIQAGHAKIKTVQKNNDKALGIGREKKHLSLIDTQTNQLIYLIKRYGIKATHYFTDALNETFKDFGVKMSQALGRDIVFTIDKLNKNGNNN